MAGRKGYRLVATTPGGPNAFLLRDDVGEHIPAPPAKEGWTQTAQVVSKRFLRDGTLGDPVAALREYVEAAELPVVEV